MMKKNDLSLNDLKQLIDTSPAAMFVVDKNRNMVFVNKSYATMFGYDIDEIKDINTKKFHVDEKSYENFAKIAFNLVLEGKSVTLDFEAKKKDGTIFWVHISGDLLKGREQVLWTMIDITNEKEAQKELEEVNYNFKQYLSVIDKIGIGIFVVDEDYRIRYMNDSMKSWFGDQTNKICYSSIANIDEPCSYCKLSDVIQDGKKVIYEPTITNGQSFDIVATSIKNSDGTISKMEVIRNITEKKRAQEKLIKQQEELLYQAYHDALTGLPNRVLLYDRLAQGIEKVKRDDTKLALLFIDLDRFKEINDSLGHDIGDEVLKIVTARLNQVTRDEDSLARLGGDEFTILMQNLNDGQDASILAQKILKVLSEPIKVEDNELYISSSIGISLCPEDGDKAKDLLKYADSAMYRAKDEGRNNFQFYSSDMTKIAFERVVMEASLREALKREEFVVYYQPQINATKDILIGMEALVRWKHPSLGIVSPDKFIPLAESTGLIVELDRFVMKSAISQVAKWYKDGLNPGILALNLSVKQLQQKDFLDFLKAIMKKYDYKSEFLELEVTESQIMENPKEAVKILNEIQDLGIELAIDDFGTGYSSLAYLKKLPIDKLKIDHSFVKELPFDDEDVAITRAVIALAKSLNLKIIAEGVETKKQRDFILENGCENIQGYYYSKPLSSYKMKIFLKAY